MARHNSVIIDIEKQHCPIGKRLVTANDCSVSDQSESKIRQQLMTAENAIFLPGGTSDKHRRQLNKTL